MTLAMNCDGDDSSHSRQQSTTSWLKPQQHVTQVDLHFVTDYRQVFLSVLLAQPDIHPFEMDVYGKAKVTQ